MLINYRIQFSHRRSISISISQDCTVLIKAPYGTPEKTVTDFLSEKKSWILKHIEQRQKQNQICQSLGKFTSEEIREIKRKAKEIIPKRVEYFAKISGITYGKISYRFQKSRWDSCTIQGNLNFNCLLVLMPPEVLDSVVIHELCHRRHMNHSKEFYAEIQKYFPDYKKWNRWLKENGGTYMARIPD